MSSCDCTGLHPSLSDAGVAFVRWMNKHNFDIHPNVQLRYVDSFQCHSVFTSGPLKEDVKLFQVPRIMTLSWRNSTAFKHFSKLTLPGWNKLILAMMIEDALPQSLWREYLDILPFKLNTPVFWGPTDLDNLKGCSILSQLGLGKIKKEYKKFILPLITPSAFGNTKSVGSTKSQSSTSPMYIIPKIQEFRRLNPGYVDMKDEEVVSKYFSFEQYKRFGSIIMAYSFTFEDGEVAMVPMADMLNHRTGMNNARLYFDTQDSEDESTDGENEDEIIDEIVDEHSHDCTSHEGSCENKCDSNEQGSNSTVSDDVSPKKRQRTPEKKNIFENRQLKKAKRRELDEFLHMRTRFEIENPNTELFNTYGNISDSELLRKYGFVEELGVNRWNEVDISVASILEICQKHCGWDSEESKKRLDFIKKYDLVDPEAVLIFPANQNKYPALSGRDYADLGDEELLHLEATFLRPDFISLVKIFAASPDEWSQAEKAILASRKKSVQSDLISEENTEDTNNETTPKSGGKLIPLSNKELLAKLASEVILAKLSLYNSMELEPDKALLASLPLFSHEECRDSILFCRASVLLRLSEKIILHDLLDSINSAKISGTL